jgi:outer membrane autotransporter protein
MGPFIGRALGARVLVCAAVLGLSVSAAAQAPPAPPAQGGSQRSPADILGNVPGSNGFQRASGVFVGNTCDGLGRLNVNPGGSGATNDLFRECTKVVVAADELDQGAAVSGLGFQVADVLQALFDFGHEESAAQGQAGVGAAVASFGALRQRLVALREGGSAIQLAGLTIRDSEGHVLHGADLEAALREHSAASGDGLFGEKFGVFLQGIGAWGDYEAGNDEVDFDTGVWGLLGGADYRFGENLVAGVAAGFSRTDDDFDRSAGDLETDVWSGSLYASWSPGAWYVDGIFTLSGIDYDLRRRISYPTVERTATGDADGWEWAASVGGGYNFQRGGLSFGPHLRVEYVDTRIDSFSEGGAGGLNLVYDDQNVQSLVSDLGLNASYPISTGFGIVTPYARVEWEHEYQDDHRTIGVRFKADPNRTRFSVRTKSPDRDVANLAGGVAVTLAGGFSAFVDVEGVLFSRDWNLVQVTAGGRFAF